MLTSIIPFTEVSPVKPADLPPLPKWAKHEVYRWAAWALLGGGSFAYLEWRGIRRKRDGDPTLTGVISRYVPGWLWFAGLGALKGWLDFHFGTAYESWRQGKPYGIPA